MSRRVTHRMIAQEAGVSIFTVSLALRDRPQITPEVRRRVQEIAERLGYRRDPRLSEVMAATRLYSASSPFQAALAYLDTALPDQRGCYAFQSYRNGVQRQAEKYGYHLDYFAVDDFMARPREAEKVMAAKNIRGLVLFWPHGEPIPEAYDRLLATNASVCLGAGPEHSRIDAAFPDHFRVGTLTAEKALAAGFRRLGLVTNSWLDATSGYRFSGGFVIRNQAGSGDQSIPICALTSGEKQNFMKWFRRYRPDCIITMHYFIWEWLRSGGVKVPEDVSLILWDVNPNDYRKWAGAEQDPYPISAVAVDLVVGQLHRQTVGPASLAKNTMVEPRWRDGPSLKPKVMGH